MTHLQVSTVITDVKFLYFLLNSSFPAVTSATVWALFLPPVKHSIYFNRTNVGGQDIITGNENRGAVLEDSCKKGNIRN
jgi:hypothetical protein